MKTMFVAVLGLMAVPIPLKAEVPQSTKDTNAWYAAAMERERASQEKTARAVDAAAQARANHEAASANLRQIQQARSARSEYVPTETEVLTDELRRLRQETERLRQEQQRAAYAAQQRAYNAQRAAANQRAITQGNRAARTGK